MRKSLLSWYHKAKREMPWRNTKDPYRIWISEIMLQQTQVHTVTPFYLRFLECFPTVKDLAGAEPGDVMKAWEGLGYYGRARNMHKAAQYMLLYFDGHVPDSQEALLTLPGIGLYTANAILSIAFGKAVPVLDGNVIRVLARLFHVTENVDRPTTVKSLWEMAQTLLPMKHAGDFNQAVMELGATLCLPRFPLCGSCPVSVHCQAFRLGIQAELPVRTPKKTIPHYDVTAGIIWKNGRFLIALRPPKGLLGGLWEFPGGKKKEGETLEECLKREIREELNIDIHVGNHLVSVNHAYTHFRITLHVFHCAFVEGEVRHLGCDGHHWITSRDLDTYAFPAADRKVIALLKHKEEAYL